MKRKVLVLALVAMFMVSIVGTAFAAEHTVEVTQSPFVDVQDTDATVEQFALLNALQIFEGYGDGTVGPDNTLTRAEFAKVVVAAMDRKSVADALSTMMPSFTDAATIPVWARGWVNASEALGLVIGRTDGTFDPMAPVTFAEAATMLVRVLGYEPAVVGPWPGAHIAKAAEIELLEGLTIFYQVPITREEMAIMTANALDITRADSEGEPRDPASTLLDDVFNMVNDTNFNKADYTFGATVALFGAADLDAAEGAEVNIIKRAGVVVFIEVVEEADVFTGDFEQYLVSSQRIKVDGQLFNLADDVDVYFNGVIADGDSPAMEFTVADLDADEDDVVKLTLSDGEVVKIEAFRLTYDNVLFNVSAIDVTTDEEDFGALGPYDVDDETIVHLNGEVVTWAEVEEALEDMEDMYGAGTPAIFNVWIRGAQIGVNIDEVYKVSVITDNTVEGEVTAKGTDSTGPFVRLDGVKYYYESPLVSGDFNIDDDVIVLLGSDDKARVILEVTVVTAADEFFALLVGFEVDADDEGEATFELSDGTEKVLAYDANANDLSAWVDMVLYVDYDGTDFVTVDLAENATAGETNVELIKVTNTYIQIDATGTVRTHPLSGSFFAFDGTLATPELVDLDDLEGEMVDVYVDSDGAVGFVITTGDTQ